MDKLANFESIIFDMDGVLIDSEVFYFQRRMNFFDLKRIEPGSRNIKDYVGSSNANTWKQLVPDSVELRQKLHKEYSVYRAIHDIHFPDVLRPEVRSVLKALKDAGKKIAIASSSPKHDIERMISECELGAYFDFVISGDELKETKPHPEIYQVSAAKLGGRCLAVEDSIVGIQAAKAAGLYTLALKQSFFIDQSQADGQLTNLKELLK
ncbi:MAG: HAD family hydrolase [Enterococcus sp.]